MINERFHIKTRPIILGIVEENPRWRQSEWQERTVVKYKLWNAVSARLPRRKPPFTQSMRLDIALTVTVRWYIIRLGDVSVLRAIFAIVLADDYDQRVRGGLRETIGDRKGRSYLVLDDI